MVKLCFLLYHVFPPRQHSAANRSPADMGARRAKKPAAGAFCVRTPACRAGGIGEPFSAPSPVRRADPTGGASPPRACGPSTHPKGPPQNANGERPTQKYKHEKANTERKPRKTGTERQPQRRSAPKQNAAKKPAPKGAILLPFGAGMFVYGFGARRFFSRPFSRYGQHVRKERAEISRTGSPCRRAGRPDGCKRYPARRGTGTR